MNTILMTGAGRSAMRHSALPIRVAELCAILLLARLCPAQTSNVVTLTFEGLKDSEPILNYYNGGYGGFGSGPGPNYGITFGSDSLAVIAISAGGTGHVSRNPSGVTTAYFLSGSGVVMNVAAGFQNGFSFYYASGGNTGSVGVYDRSGNVLKTISLGNASYCDPNWFYSCWSSVGVTFTGTAYSVNFSGTANYITFDNITLGTGVATAPLVITTTSLPSGTVNVGYNATLSATGGTSPYTWTATGLPPGLTLAANGVISGMPTTAGTYSVTFTVTDSTKPALTAKATLPLVVNQPTITLTVSCSPQTGTYTAGVQYSTTCTASKGTAPYTWSFASLPSWLKSSATSGATVTLSGTVPSPPPNSYSVTVTVTDSTTPTKQTVPTTVTINVSAALLLSCSSTSGPVMVGVSYSTACTASGGTPPYTFTISSGSLPQGLTAASTATTFTISGKPTASGGYNYTVQVKDGSGQIATRSFVGTISSAPVVSTFAPNPVSSAPNQYTVSLALSSAPAVALTGTICLKFTPSSTVVNASSYQSQEVVFANGTTSQACSTTLKTTLGFTISTASATAAWTGGNSQFSQGTVAGTIQLTMVSLVDSNGNSVLPSPAPSQTLTVASGLPALTNSPQMTTTSNSVTVVFDAVTSTRRVTGVTYTFNQASGAPITFPVAFNSGTYNGYDQQWFGTAASVPTGGAFSLTVTLACTNCSALTGVQVALTN